MAEENVLACMSKMSIPLDEVLSFSEAEAEAILCKENLEQEGGEITPEELSREIVKWRKKEIDYKYHAITLSDYYKDKKIPTGFRIKNIPTIGKQSPEFCRKWISILNKCSQDLMLLVIDQSKSELIKIRNKLEQLELTHMQKLINDTSVDWLSKMKAQVDSYAHEIIKYKKEKLVMVNRDYQELRVYNWLYGNDLRSRKTFRRPYNRTQQLARNQDSTASSQSDIESEDRIQAEENINQRPPLGVRTRSQPTINQSGAAGYRMGPGAEYLAGAEEDVPRNYFYFNGRHYLQRVGCAMGSNVAPTFANLYMNHYEENYLYSDDRFRQGAVFYCRFIDDLFIIWKSDIQIFNELLGELNSNSSPIQFTCDISDKIIHYLDVNVAIEDCTIVTSIYNKPTDRNNLLHASSYHPPPLKYGLPYSQMLRVNRITSDTLKRDEQMMDMCSKFVSRGYDRRELLKIMDKVKSIPRNDSLTSKIDKKLEDRIPWVQTFTTESQTIRKTAKRYWPMVRADTDLPCFKNKTLMPSYRRGKNLRDLLVKTDVTIKQRITSKVGCYRCSNCVTCRYMDPCTHFFHLYSGKKYQILHALTCTSKYVI